MIVSIQIMQKGYREMQSLRYEIKSFPDDVYRAVGEIIRWSQEWEQVFKKLVRMLHLRIKNINESSLNKLCDALKKQVQITQKEYDDLKRIIWARNYINHKFFIVDFQGAYETYDLNIEHLQTKLNFACDIIFEATDFILNKIDQINGDDIMRPTVVGK